MHTLNQTQQTHLNSYGKKNVMNVMLWYIIDIDDQINTDVDVFIRIWIRNEFIVM